MAWIYRYGTVYKDIMRSSLYVDDIIIGNNGDDFMFDSGMRGQTDYDYLSGDNGNDRLFSHWGRDILKGGRGGDLIVSRSDAGEPIIGQNPAIPRNNPSDATLLSNDRLYGGLDWDTFMFNFDFNAKPEFIAKHTDRAGDIDWGAVGEEGVNPHDHWIESIGTDTIEDFYRDEGDRIVLNVHSAVVDIVYGDTNGDGRNDQSVLTVRSDTGGTGAHHNDILGTIIVRGDFVVAADITINDPVVAGDHHSMRGVVGSLDDRAITWTNEIGTPGNDLLRAFRTNAHLSGGDGDDIVLDGSKKGETDTDWLSGGNGNDVLRSRWGRDTMNGGAGDDLLVSRSDAGEPVIAQKAGLKKVYPNEPFLNSSDTMTGGLGADTFFFRMDLNAVSSIIAKHTDDQGGIDWHGVTGENGGPHYHWVESIGTDTITDFYRAEGDKIVVEGHTAQLKVIRYYDTNGDLRTDLSVLEFHSQQGASGAHDEDLIGLIKVYGDVVQWGDVEVNAGPAHGLTAYIDDLAAV